MRERFGFARIQVFRLLGFRYKDNDVTVFIYFLNKVVVGHGTHFS